MKNKGCEVSHLFKKGFILSQENILTLTSIIHQRYEDELVYELMKNDSYIYQTSDLDEIFKEENGKANRISKFSIGIDSGDKIRFYLGFEKGERTILKIMGEDKDKIFLLYNEIKTYVEKEITTAKTFMIDDNLQSICSILSIFFMFGSMISMVFLLGKYNSSEVEKIINSSDIELKINYLIMRRENGGRILEEKMGIILIVMMCSVVIIFLPKLGKILFGEKGIISITDYFLIGKEKNLYERKMKTRNNVIWTIGIGMVVSVVAGLIVYFFTK